MATNYLVMKDLIDKADTEFFAAFERFEERLAQLDLEMGSPRAQESAAQVVQTWPIEGTDCEIKIYDNRSSKVRFIEISSQKKALLKKVTDIANKTLPVESHKEILGRWRKGPKESNLLAKLAFSAPEKLGNDLVKLVIDALRDPDPETRSMAAFAAGVLFDPRFEGPLLERAEVEDHAGVVQSIDQVLSLYHR